MATGRFTKIDVLPRHLVNDGPFMRHYEKEWHMEVARNLSFG